MIPIISKYLLSDTTYFIILKGESMNDGKLQWHDAFGACLQIELGAEASTCYSSDTNGPRDLPAYRGSYCHAADYYETTLKDRKLLDASFTK